MITTQGFGPPANPDAAVGTISDPSKPRKGAVVTVSYTPRQPGYPEIPPTFVPFDSLDDAKEWTKKHAPDPKALGSPKQALYRRARALGMDPAVLAQYTLSFATTERTANGPARAADPQPGPAPADQPPVSRGPAHPVIRGLESHSDILPLRQAPVSEEPGDEAEDSEELSWDALLGGDGEGSK